MASEFEKKYGESLITLNETNTLTIAEIDELIQKEREVKRADGEHFVLLDRKQGLYHFAVDGTFTLPKKNELVILIKKEAEIAKFKTEQDAKQKELAEKQKKESEGKQSTEKRDFLRAIEVEVQKMWAEQKTFELDAPADTTQPKFLATFPYPYMNGKLHLGHSFTVSKAEFAVGYERLKGKNALFPYGFHCTGMPIKACADKIKREIETYGNPPNFPPAPETFDIKIYLFEENRPKKKGEAKSKKAKASAKSDSKVVYQWDIMKSSHVTEKDIPSFADANHWLDYFPPLAIQDLKSMGVKADWRRSFITTDVNPYYDAFVRWQFIRLKELGKIKFGKRYTIYSARDGGPCMDHDRQTGEGVAPQEYTLVKQELLKPFPAKLQKLEETGKKVYLVPATLRPETMYGQTNCWVLPDGDYGAFEVNDKEIFICTERSARNLSFQNWSHAFGEVKTVMTFKGVDLLGAAIHAPLTKYDKIYVLPMFSINTQKTTGIVTSVPSDSPDDYAAYADCKKKLNDFKSKNHWNLTEEMVSLPIVDIINVPGLGDRVAETLVDQLGIKSQNDRALLDKAKETAYQKGFYEGTMIIGDHKGMKVIDAKPLIRNMLVEQGVALPYCEPASQVISRSGEECVVALIDQWYIDYGEEEWRKLASKCLAAMDTFSEETRNQFIGALDWMRQWACSRSYGLGTKLPWDEAYLIDSLSDSTIYMAYYSIAHILQNGTLDGRNGNPQIKPEAMTPEVFDYIFLGKEAPQNTTIPKESLEKMRREFEYWYPVDLRVSGKDLIPNHLLFFIYNHTALFSESKWPKGVRANGHLLLNNQKMSKSTGNFITLGEAVERYGADGMRFALADAGDSLEDANFTDDTANSAILRLHTQIHWIKETLEVKDLREGEPSTFYDHMFLNEMRQCVETADHAYSRMNYKEAVKAAFYDLQATRDEYRVNCTAAGVPMNKKLLHLFVETQTIVIAPICPHSAEHIWMKILGNKTSVTSAKWPSIGAPDTSILRQKGYINYVSSSIRQKITQVLKKKGAAKPTTCMLFVAKRYPAWQEACITLVENLYRANDNKFPDKNKLTEAAKQAPAFQTDGKLDGNLYKKAMQFLSAIEEDLKARGEEAFALEVPFSEVDVLSANIDAFKKQLNLETLTVHSADDESVQNDKKALAVPGKPGVHLQ